jgi:transposase-like protein
LPGPARVPQRDSSKYFKTAGEFVALAMMLCVRRALSLRDFKDFLHERGIDFSHKALRYLWHRLRPLIAADIARLHGRNESQPLAPVRDVRDDQW